MHIFKTNIKKTLANNEVLTRKLWVELHGQTSVNHITFNFKETEVKMDQNCNTSRMTHTKSFIISLSLICDREMTIKTENPKQTEIQTSL